MASNNLGRTNKTVTQKYFLTNAENMESIFTRFMCRSSLLVFIISEPVVDCVDLEEDRWGENRRVCLTQNMAEHFAER